VSGGSALRVLEAIPSQALNGNITIGLTDNRYTQNPEEDNFVALTKTEFYTRAAAAGCVLLPMNIGVGESHAAYVARLNSILETYYAEHTDACTIGLFGIGEDGHTASIFSAPKTEFDAVYRTDTHYVLVENQNVPEPLRVSVSTSFIEEKCDHVVLYAVGSTKCDNILSYMHTKHLEQHELPALIPAQHPSSQLYTDCEALI
jgi:6-phosphogluconolactonase/glucosamine-6-phosphate isomerase/deaminase